MQPGHPWGDDHMTSRKKVAAAIALLCAQQATAQTGTGTGLPSSPSDGTSTVSPTSVANAVAPNEPFDLSIGSSVASGHFGAPSRSTIWNTAFGLRFATGGLRLTGSVPYMRVRSAGLILTGIDSTPVPVFGPLPGPRRTISGLGDLTLGAAYTLPSGPGGLEVELSGRVKLPTASNDLLSSGKTDYSAGLQLTKAIGRVAPFVSTTYRVLGDTRSLHLKDGFAASAGASAIFGSVVVLGSYHYANRASDFVHDSHELFAGASALLSRRLRLTGFATKGLSTGAAGESGGIGLALVL